jgi:hypothetical protein
VIRPVRPPATSCSRPVRRGPGLVGSQKKPSIASRTAGQAGLQVTEHEVVEDGSVLVIRGQNSAVQTGAFLGIEPTARRVAGSAWTCTGPEPMAG